MAYVPMTTSGNSILPLVYDDFLSLKKYHSPRDAELEITSATSDPTFFLIFSQ